MGINFNFLQILLILILIGILHLDFFFQISKWSYNAAFKITNISYNDNLNSHYLKEQNSTMTKLIEMGFPYSYDPWQSYVIHKSGLNITYKGPIVKGWPPGKDRFLPHYIRQVNIQIILQLN